MHYDFLIVGQGTAGSLLAWQLMAAGQRVLVIDNGNPAAASRVAAGLVNPVTGKRLVMERHAERVLQAAHRCYSALAEQFGEMFYHEKSMLRLFDSHEIKQAWEKRRQDEDYQAFIGEALEAADCGYRQGGFLQRQTAYVSTARLLGRLRTWLREHDALLPAEFDYAELDVTNTVSWKNHTARKIIFCEGSRIIDNPWFGRLPMQPSKGEILTIESESPLPHWIVNSGQWLLPLDNGRFRLGATYDWPRPGKPLDELPTEEGQRALLTSLPGLFPGLDGYRLLEHRAGIRPNSKDKRPLIGFHHQYRNLAVFNGFGSKGSMLIPYYSAQFVEVLLNEARIDADVDIARVLS